MEGLEFLKSEVDRLRSALRDAQERYDQARILVMPFKVGDVFRYVGNWRVDQGKRGKITSYERGRWGSSPVAILTLFKKDGSLGQRTKRLSDYDAEPESGWVKE